MKARLLDGDVHVHYSQFYVAGPGLPPDMGEAFRGQANGLCGAGSPGALFLITGLHTGPVPVTVDHLDAAPPVDDAWEDVVEVSLRITGDVFLVEWAGQSSTPLALPPGDYRVRDSAAGMDGAHEADTRLSGDPAIDSYLLEFWPAAPSADAVVRSGSAQAAYWHEALG